MNGPEFSRIIKLRAISGAPVVLEASEAERAALAARFGISAIESLTASIDLVRKGERVRAEGALVADVVQACAISGEDFGHRIEENIALAFVPAGGVPESEEIELDADDLDEIDYDGEAFDLGEAVAQTLGLAIDPYAEGPDAEAVRKQAGISSDDTPSGPLAEALAALKKN